MHKNRIIGNNIKAMIILIMIALIINLFFYQPDDYSLTLNIIVGSLIYVISGFLFLRPAKHSIISVLSVFVLLLFIAIIETLSDYIGLFSTMLNPCYIEFLYDITKYNELLSVYISAIIPSLCMYFGLKMKEIVSRHVGRSKGGFFKD